MSIEVSESLASFFSEQAGQGLRLVAHYDPDSFELLYVRDDLKTTYTRADFEQSFDTHQRDMEMAREQQAVLDAGTHHATVRMYDDAIVFNVAQTDEIGTVVSLDPSTGRDLLQFVTRVLEELHRNSPQTVTAPSWAVD